ncbi:MAG: cysteine synthase A [Clostridia bacterium]|nr:cysteine synthase A [Clostridia bacterium]
MKVYSSILDLVGGTPVIRLSRLENALQIKAKLYAKLESFNPAGSIKDRVGKNIIETAEKEGKLKKGSVVIEPTSGNTGIGLALVCLLHGYKVILTMPETMSIERRKLLKGYGAEIVLTEGSKGMQGAIDKANELLSEIPNSILAGQFENPSNPETHYKTTGKEIWEDLDGDIDVFVASVGTGGTLSGVGKYLKEKNKNVKVVAVEPSASAVLSGEKAGSHKIQGIGAGFIPKTLDTSVYDKVVKVSDNDAINYAKLLAKHEGVLAGISSGATLYGAIEVAKNPEFIGKNIVLILPDGGEKYLSTELFE